MPNRVKDMELKDILAGNLTRVCKEHDLSTLELAKRCQAPQKTVWNMINAEHSCRLSNLEMVCKTLLVSPTAMLTPHLPTGVLMSRRLPRMIDKYAKLDMEQRGLLDTYMDQLLGVEQEI